MEVQIAVSKIKKYASSDSGDTVEVVERPQGGLSVVMADGQSSGKGAKSISTMVVRKVISLLAEGVRDGAAARAASDYLFTERSGKVSATLNIISIDMVTQTLVLTRNSPVPALIAYDEEIQELDEDSSPVGIYRDTRPIISEISLDKGLTALAFTDGLIYAGSLYGNRMDVVTHLQCLLEEEEPSPQMIADDLINQAIRLDQGRPRDDISIVVLRVISHRGDTIRRMTVRLPLNA